MPYYDGFMRKKLASVHKNLCRAADFGNKIAQAVMLTSRK